ncbi:hypothetical protein [Formosa sp. PL04]|uniref:hypothetical protein n=1 Tax=Formosa sp. PL04 TaxID=3081755 RepID=UPI002980B85B|nr:hypothetical protein [Formosa sp. PL04]MDW5287630.1 hypothetical protein [Formosa sp. PL04]
MKTSQLKMVSFSSKGYKKQLIISSKQVAVLRTFLIESLSCEVLIINTNLGLDVYYVSIKNQKVIIENSILLLLAKKGRSIFDFFIRDFNTSEDISLNTHLFFKRLIEHPMLFKSYSKSLCHQINVNYTENSKIIQALFLIWQEELLCLNNTDLQVYVLRSFLSNLQSTYIQQSCKLELQDLIKSALDVEHCN